MNLTLVDGKYTPTPTPKEDTLLKSVMEKALENKKDFEEKKAPTTSQGVKEGRFTAQREKKALAKELALAQKLSLVTVTLADTANSLINTQNDVVQRVLVPQGITLTTSPSLTPYLGSLAQMIGVPDDLFIGNGTDWKRIQGGLPVLLPTINFNSNTTGAIVATNAFIVTASPISASMVAVTLRSAVTANASATSSLDLVTVLPTGYRPVQSMSSFCSIFLNGGFVKCIFNIMTSGVMQLQPESGPFQSTDTGIILNNYFSVYMIV